MTTDHDTAPSAAIIEALTIILEAAALEITRAQCRADDLEVLCRLTPPLVTALKTLRPGP